MSSKHPEDAPGEGRAKQAREMVQDHLQKQGGKGPASFEELVAAHPELALELVEELRKAQLIEEARQRARERRGRQQRAHEPAPPDASTYGLASDESHPERAFEVIRYFGDYELLEEIAHGGMGMIWKARQISLNRVVAVKLILSGQLASERDVQRFYAEAEAAANLEHSNIVPIYEVGLHQGQHYFSMAFVEGESLEEMIRESPLTSRTAARYIKAVAEAIHYAHQRGVLHRDLKPSNVLIDHTDQPKVTDFGLAKRVSSDSDLTATGQILGTPSYMPPEQALGKHEEVDARSDVYSIGATLYTLLTGRPPFRAASQAATLVQVINTEPLAPRLLNPTIDRDLETICLRCLEKTPSRRYTSAAVLADELDRYLRGEPIRARRIGRAARAWRWCQRNRVVAALTGLAAVLLLLVAIVGSWGLVSTSTALQRVEQERERKEEERREAERLRQEAEQLRREAERERDAARNARDAEMTVRAFAEQKADEARRQKEEADKRREEAEEARHLAEEALAEAEQHKKLSRKAQEEEARQRQLTTEQATLVRQLEEEKTEQEKLAGQLAKEVQVQQELARQAQATRTEVEAQAQKRQADLLQKLNESSTRHRELVEQLQQQLKQERASGQQAKAAATTERQLLEKQARLLRNELAVLRLKAYNIQVARAAAAWQSDPAGCKRLLDDPILCPEAQRDFAWGLLRRLCDTEEVSLVSTKAGIRAVAFSADGELLASADDHGRVKLWDRRSWQVKREFSSPMLDPILRRAYEEHVEQDSGSRTRVVAPVPSRDKPGWPPLLQFSPDARLLAAQERDFIGVWDTALGKSVDLLIPEISRPRFFAFSPDRSQLACVGSASDVLFFRLDSSAKPFARKNIDATITAIVYSPDGDNLALAKNDGTIDLWDARSLSKRATIGEQGRNIVGLAYGPESKPLALAMRDGTIELCDPATGKPIRTMRAGEELSSRIAYAPTGDKLAVACQAGSIILWDVATGEQAVTFKGHDLPITCLAFSPDGRLLASCSAGLLGRGELKVWKVEVAAEQLTIADPPYPVSCLAFSPDGTMLASANWENKIKLRNANTGKIENVLDGHDRGTSVHLASILHLAFSPDGSVLASSGRDNRIRLWNTTTGEELGVLETTDAPAIALAFSEDAKRLASAGEESVTVWDLEKRQKLTTLAMRGLHPRIRPGERIYPTSAVMFLAKGDGLAAVSAGRVIYVWEVRETVDTGAAPILGPSGLSRSSSHEEEAIRKVLQQGSSRRLIVERLVLQKEFGKDYTICSQVALSPSGAMIAATERDIDTGRWRLATYVTHTGHEMAAVGGEFEGLAFAPVGVALVTSRGQGTLDLWDPFTGERRASLAGHPVSVTALAFTEDGRCLATADSRGTTKIWSSLPYHLGKRITDCQTLKSRSGAVCGLAFASDGKSLVYCTDGEGIRRWEPDTGRVQRNATPTGFQAKSVTFSSDGKVLVWAAADHTLTVWDVGAGQKTADFGVDAAESQVVALAPDGTKLAAVGSSSEEDTSTVTLLGTGEQQQGPHKIAMKAICAGMFSPDGSGLALAARDGAIGVWDTEKWNQLRTFDAGRPLDGSLAFSPDGRTLACSSGNDVLILDCEPGQRPRLLEGHTRPVLAVAFSPDGKLLASAAADATIRLWNPWTGRVVATLKGDDEVVRCIAFSGDGGRLAAGCAEGTLKVWQTQMSSRNDTD